MTGVLVDTSVWVEHFRQHSAELVELLERDLVLLHPLVVGEIMCGTPPNRLKTLADFSILQQPQQANVQETLAFIERERLFGLGCGLVDMLLLSSTLLTPGTTLWTRDKRLGALASRFGVMYRPILH